MAATYTASYSLLPLYVMLTCIILDCVTNEVIKNSLAMPNLTKGFFLQEGYYPKSPTIKKY